MPAADRVVANTSPLLNLALVDRLELLETQFSSVRVPEQVWDELMEGNEGVEELERRKDGGMFEIVPVEETDVFREFRRELDLGESAAIAHAIEIDADLILLDEREARATAKRHGLNRTGVVGILLRAASDGQVDLRTELDALREAGFWINDNLFDRALGRFEERTDE